MSHQHVLGIIEDLQHNIWASTANGITHVLISQDSVQGELNYCCYPYTDIDGLGNITFTPRSMIRTTDGTILVGGTGALLAFKPNDTTNNFRKKSKVILQTYALQTKLSEQVNLCVMGESCLIKVYICLKELN